MHVLVHHGTPSSGRLYAAWEQDGIELVGFDRSGYGDAPRRHGRSVADVVDEVVALADARGIDRFATWGISGGGPHALACAALLPDRVIAAAAIGSPAPRDADGLDWYAGFGEGNVVEFNAALEGEAALSGLCTDLRLMSLQRLQAGRLDWMGDDYALSDADKAQMQRHFIRTRAHIANGLTGSADGWIDDNLAMVKPWGFDVASIRVPVLLTYGRTDVLVPAAHGDWLAEHVPGAIAWVDEDSGHLGADEQMEREYAWLTGRQTEPAATLA